MLYPKHWVMLMFMFSVGFCQEEDGIQSHLNKLISTIERLELKIQDMDDRMIETQQHCSLTAQYVTKDECKMGSDHCSTHAACQDLHVGYNCTCLPGFEGDGFTCRDIDECATRIHVCDPKSECINTEGDYTCNCPPGYIINNDYLCERKPCDSPSVFMEDLGCLIPVNNKTSWTIAKKQCQSMGAQMLEGIKTRDQIIDLHKNFQYLSYPWVGLYDWKWLESNGTISESSPLVMYYDSKGSGKSCGAVYLYDDQSLGFFSVPCYEQRKSICQKI